MKIEKTTTDINKLYQQCLDIASIEIGRLRVKSKEDKLSDREVKQLTMFIKVFTDFENKQTETLSKLNDNQMDNLLNDFKQSSSKKRIH